MELLHLHIPNDLKMAVNKVSDNFENFVIRAIRHELVRTTIATDADVEKAAVLDQSIDFLSSNELKYYLNLPNNV